MIEITWLGHGTFLFRLESGEIILVDPWVEGNPSYPKDFKIPPVDVMLLTHGHFDHTGDAVFYARKYEPQVVANYEICQWLGSKGVENLCPMNKGGSQTVGPITVRMTHALHSSSMEEDGKLIYGGEAAGYILHWPDGRRLYFAGDTNVFSDMALIRELYQPELAILPIGDLFTMSPQEAALACRLLTPKKVIPMHFGTFPPLVGRPIQLADFLKDEPTQVWELTPGKPVQW